VHYSHGRDKALLSLPESLSVYMSVRENKSYENASVTQYFRNYKPQGIRSPFDASSPVSSPRKSGSSFSLDNDDYEYEELVLATSSPTKHLKREITSLPNIKLASSFKKIDQKVEKSQTIQEMLSEEAVKARERNKYYWGQEGKDIFKAHREEFERAYDKSARFTREDNNAWTPRSLYLRDSIETGHTPVLEMIPIRKHSNFVDGVLNLSLKGLTGARLSSLSHVLPMMPHLTHFDLRNNRANLHDGSTKSLLAKPSKGLSKVFASLATCPNLTSIDVSENIVTTSAVATLGRELTKGVGFSGLHTLCMQSCGLTDHHITPEIAKQLAGSQLRMLNLSANKFSRKNGALFNIASISDKIQVNGRLQLSWKCLEKLIISDNKFHEEDLIQFFKALKKKKGCFSRVSTIYCSMIQIGKYPAVISELGAALAHPSCSIKKMELRSVCLGMTRESSWVELAQNLGQNDSVIWLDFSHNQLSSESTIVLGNQLLLNHTVLDLYYRHGNCGRVDNMGFLLPACIMTTSAIEDASHGHYEKPELDVHRRRHFEHSDGLGHADRDYPWITGQWSEVLFSWTPGLSGSGTDQKVYLRLGADRWWPCPLEWDEVSGSFQVWRSLPPGKYKYLFQVGGTDDNKNQADLHSFEFADDQQTEALLDPSISFFDGWTPQSLMVNVTTVPANANPTFMRAPPRPSFAYDRRKFDEEEFQNRKTPEFAQDVENTGKKVEKHAHGLIASVFAPRRSSADHESQYYDLPERYNRAADADMNRMVRGGGLKEIISPFELVGEVEQFMRDNFSIICHIHRWYASYGTGSLFAMNMGVFRMFLNNIQLIGSAKRGESGNGDAMLTEHDIVMIFKKAETSQYARKAGDKSNSVGKALDRYEFAEALIRIALKLCASPTTSSQKRQRALSSDSNVSDKSSVCEEEKPTNVIEGLRYMFQNFMEPYSDRSSGNEFRKKFLYLTGVDAMLRKRMHLLKSVFHHYAAMFSHGRGRNTLSFKEWETLIKIALKWDAPVLSEVAQSEQPSTMMKELVKRVAMTAAPAAEQEQAQLDDNEEEDHTQAAFQKEEEVVEFGNGDFSLGLDFDGDNMEDMEEGDPEDVMDLNETDDGVPFQEWDPNDEATARAVQLIQVRVRRILARLRVQKAKDAKMERILALRAASEPLQPSDGSQGLPKGQFQRKHSIRTDVLELSETIRKEQEAEMGLKKEKNEALIGGLTDLDVRQAFSFSQMLFIDELTASKSHLQFCDFLEALVRLSQTISNTMNKKREDPAAAMNPNDAWYDADGVLRAKKPNAWGMYESVGEADEEVAARLDVEHLARFESLLDKICTADVGQKLHVRRK